MRYFVFLLILFFACIANSADTNLTFIKQVPSLRAEALRKAKPSNTDSSSDIYIKNEAFYESLKVIIKSLRSKYYFHDEFPEDITSGLEKHAVVLAGIQYPLSKATGCSGYDAILIKNKIMLAENMICQMVEAIYSTEHWDSQAAQPSKTAVELYRAWLEQWNAKSK